MTVAPLPATSHIAWANLGIVLDEPWNMPEEANHG